MTNFDKKIAEVVKRDPSSNKTIEGKFINPPNSLDTKIKQGRNFIKSMV